MLDSQDQQFIKELVEKTEAKIVESAVKTEAKIVESAVKTEAKIVESAVKTEAGIIEKTDSKIVEAVEKSEARIIGAVGDMLEQNVLPVLEKLDERLTRVEAEMVTKAYLDEKLADLRGDLVVLTRKEDTKLRELVTVLHEKNILTDPDIKRILSMEPFSQLML